MKCPVCADDLLLAERQGVEIDYCPKCRGVWLDRGELDILIERSNALGYGPSRSQDIPERHGECRSRESESYQRDDRHHAEEHHGRGHHGGHHGPKGRKRRSFLEDLFDFGD